MFCSKCGTQLPDGSKFCPACGAPCQQETTPPETESKTVSLSKDSGQEQATGSGSSPSGSGTNTESAQPGGGFNSNAQSGGGFNSNTQSGGGFNSNTQSGGGFNNAQPGGGFNNAQSGGGFNNSTQPGGGSNNSSQSGGKFDFSAYLTQENIERFGPLAAFLPFVMSFSVGIIGRIIRHIPFVGAVIIFLLSAIFVLASLAAAGALVYLTVTKKDTSKVATWIVPGVACLAFIGCICHVFHWSLPAGLISVFCLAMGLDFLARITIRRMPLDSPITPADDIELYKKYINQYMAEHPSVTQAETTAIINPQSSYFDGSGLELLGMLILAGLVSAVTCGIAAPWMICKIYSWRISHTVINGKRLTFNGTGGSLLGNWILWEVLTVITCGIYGFFTYVALCKWETSHTFIDGEPMIAGQQSSYFDGNSFEFLGYSILGGLIITFTCGIGYPWVMCMIQDWQVKHQIISGRRLRFSGSGLGFLGEFIIIAILSAITCGIYSSWGIVRMNKYIVSHTDFS